MKDSYMFYIDRLNDEYKDVFKQIEMYVSTQNVDEITREDRLGSLLDMFLTAQKQGKPVSKIVGNDIKEFCKSFCSDLGTKNRIFNLLDTIKRLAWLELLFSFFSIFSADWQEGADFWSTVSQFNLSGYIIAITLSLFGWFTVNSVVGHFMFKGKKFNMNLLQGISVVSCFLLFFLSFYFLEEKFDFLKVPIWAVVLVCCVYLIFYYIFNRKRLTENKREKVSFFKMVQDETYMQFSGTMNKKMESLNKKRAKKGKPQITLEEFLQREEKDLRISKYIGCFFLTSPAILTLIQFILGEFPTIWDGLSFFVIDGIITYVWWQFLRNGDIARQRWIDEQRDNMNNQYK